MGPTLERLIALFVGSYPLPSLRLLLFTRMNRTLANEVSENDGHRNVVFNLLMKALVEGWLIPFARYARDELPGRGAEWVPMVVELEAVMTRGVVQPAPGLVATPRTPDPPEELIALIKRYDQLLTTADPDAPASDQMTDLLSRFQRFPLSDYSLTDSFLWSDSPGRRMVAILALTARPQVRYLWWLAERVGVEPPFVGVRAAEGIRAAATNLPSIELDAVARAAAAAVRWIAGTIPLSDDHLRLRASFDMARKALDVLSDAIKLTEQR